MKSSRYHKVLGLAVGERSILAAEVSASGDQPEAKKLAEFTFPEGISAQDPAALGKALAAFLREHQFSVKHAVVGIPAKWLVVKSKELPPADKELAADMLRLGAEGEFSSELKDLVYDYAGEPNPAKPQTVLLMATPHKYVDLARQMCEAARLDLVAVTASVAALSVATGRTAGKNAVVLSMAPGGAELSAQTGGHTSVLRHLRSPMPEALFLSDLRRAVLQIPTNGTAREMVIWNATDPQSAPAFSTGLGMQVHTGDLRALGVGADASASNGGGRKYAPAVALALSCLGERSLSVDFLHSKLAPPKQSRIPSWAVYSALGAILLIAGSVLAYRDLQNKQANLNELTTKWDGEQAHVKTADSFVSQVSLARGWHGGEPRYLACLLDLTRAFPEDGLIFVTSMNLKETPKIVGKNSDVRTITGQVHGKAPDQRAAQLIPTQLSRISGFSEVHLTGVTNATSNNGRDREVTFIVTFIFTPPKAAK